LKFYTLTAIILISFVLNGCILDRIKQRVYAKKQIQKQEQAIKRREATTADKKVYTPSKPTATIYKEEKELSVKHHKVKKASSKVKTTKKKYSKKRHYVRKKVKLKPEPYSIEKDEQDPELLGPQTTLDSNPLTNNSKAKESDKKKI